MRYVCSVAAALQLGSFFSFLLGAPALVAPNMTVGSNLETAATVSLSQGAPDGGLDFTLVSSDVNRLRFAKRQDQPGSASLALQVRPGYRESPEFWVQGLGSAGTVSYIVKTAEGESTGTVTVTPSAIIITGPMKAPKFPTTTRSTPLDIRLSAVRLDSALKFAEDQFVAGGLSVRVDLLSSKTAVGAFTPTHLEIPGGTNFATTQFQPASEGDTVLSVRVPPGFSAPAEFGAVTAMVKIPGLVVSDQLALGQNLELRGVLSLGAAAPPGGLHVTLSSNDPDRLLLSASATGIGSKSITITVPADGAWGPYYLQALESSGSVTYSATAAGYRSGTSTVLLTPSGIVLTPIFQGPPDEAQVLRKEPKDGTYSFLTKLSKPALMNLVAWTVQLDPVTHRSADITVQPLRGGLSLKIPLANSNPAVGKVISEVTISGGTEHSVTPFNALSIGSTEISVTTPKNFTVSANSTKVIAIVQ